LEQDGSTGVSVHQPAFAREGREVIQVGNPFEQLLGQIIEDDLSSAITALGPRPIQK
jgi:hypothetical protein